MGDIIHALPAVASLKHNYPGSRLTWAIEPRWAPLLADNPFVDRLVFIRRDPLPPFARAGATSAFRTLRFRSRLPGPPEIRPDRHVRAPATDLRLPPDADPRARRRPLLLQQDLSHSVARRRQESRPRRLRGRGLRAQEIQPAAGDSRGDLPPGEFVLASPLAGWTSKQWPIEYYRDAR